MKKLKRIMMTLLALMTMLTAGFGFIGCNKEEDTPVSCACYCDACTCENKKEKYDAIICFWTNQGDEWMFPVGQDYLEVEYAYDGTERKMTRGVYKMPDNPAPGGGWSILGGANATYEWAGTYVDPNGVESHIVQPLIITEKGRYTIKFYFYSEICKNRTMQLTINVV